MCGQGELVNLASINLQLGTKKQMNYKIRKNEEVADFNYVRDLLLPYILTNLVLYSKFELYICYESIYQFFSQIDQFLLYWQIRQKLFVFRHVNWSSRDQCT